MIVINARFLTQPITGVQRFAVEICKELIKEYQVEIVCPKNIIHNELAVDLDAKIIGDLVGHKWEQISLVRYVNSKENVLLVSLCNTGPLLIKNQIITIHDICFKLYPKWFSRRFSIWYNFLIPIIAHRAKHIITVSRSSKKEIVEFLGVNEEKVSVVYNGISEVFQSTLDESSSFSVNSDYILTVSSHHPRKNFKRLIQAFNLLNRDDLNLLVVGNFNKHFINDLNNFEIDGKVRFLTNVSDADLIHYYKNAKLFVYPSLYEGFGIPIIEAAIQGVPLCVSDIAVFKEVCENQAYYFNPEDIKDIKESMAFCLENSLKPDIDFFIERYSWKKSARNLIQILEQ